MLGGVIVIAGAILVAPSMAGAWGIQTPSKNIQCGEIRRAVVCLIFKQSFVEPRSCDGTYTASASASRRGRAAFNVGCFGGVPYAISNVRTLGYGQSETRNGVTCRSSTKGLRCTNRDHHGFFLSKRKGYRF